MRHRALDWLRGIAVLVMVECHVFNALLAPEYRSSTWFGFLNWLNGFIAPAFLLVSGAVMGTNLQNRWQKGTGKMWRRVSQIFVVAYLLHFPAQLLWKFASAEAARLVELWTRMDILQSIGASLALMLLLVPVTRTPAIHRGVCAALGVLAATTVAPTAQWATDADVPAWLLNYLWPTGVGLFPLAPWAGFPLIGVWLGPAIFLEKSRPKQCLRAVLAGTIMLVASRFMTGERSYGGAFVFERMGWVLVALGGCVWLDLPTRGTGWILQFGELSLWSYTVHLLIVYWVLAPLLGARFSPTVAVAFLAGVLVATAVVVRWRAKTLQRCAALRMMLA